MVKLRQKKEKGLDKEENDNTNGLKMNKSTKKQAKTIENPKLNETQEPKSLLLKECKEIFGSTDLYIVLGLDKNTCTQIDSIKFFL
jgi:hypothetical protein